MTTAANGLDDAQDREPELEREQHQDETGIDRKNSTTTPAGQRIQAWSDSRAMPSSAPIGSAITTLTAAACRVAHSPGSR